ncbi:hypothetical protein E2C01_023359 [Portunus trituberculatus]|uniref:Uncharacterized protein n=1 Tax=Portunus trituberculatus TaxID=210409 RepID=A0A5B7EAY2_PORTR|nr:hypothetical protein [Portunus trituberculatus]
MGKVRFFSRTSRKSAEDKRASDKVDKMLREERLGAGVKRCKSEGEDRLRGTIRGGRAITQYGPAFSGQDTQIMIGSRRFNVDVLSRRPGLKGASVRIRKRLRGAESGF